jgi:SAM-dependent methyltransferase
MARGFVDRVADRPLLFHYLRKLPELNYRATKARIRRILERREPGRALDLGCGTGEFAELFAPEGYLGVDVHPGYVALARRLRPGHRFECHDGTAWEGDGRPFDLTLVNGVLHHLDDATARALLAAAVRHTRPGGTLVVIEDAEIPDGGPLTGLVHALDHGHFIRTPETWTRLVREFFAIEESETYRSGLCPYHLMVGVRS